MRVSIFVSEFGCRDLVLHVFMIFYVSKNKFPNTNTVAGCSHPRLERPLGLQVRRGGSREAKSIGEYGLGYFRGSGRADFGKSPRFVVGPWNSAKLLVLDFHIPLYENCARLKDIH